MVWLDGDSAFSVWLRTVVVSWLEENDPAGLSWLASRLDDRLDERVIELLLCWANLGLAAPR